MASNMNNSTSISNSSNNCSVDVSFVIAVHDQDIPTMRYYQEWTDWIVTQSTHHGYSAEIIMIVMFAPNRQPTFSTKKLQRPNGTVDVIIHEMLDVAFQPARGSIVNSAVKNANGCFLIFTSPINFLSSQTGAWLKEVFQKGGQEQYFYRMEYGEVAWSPDTFPLKEAIEAQVEELGENPRHPLWRVRRRERSTAEAHADELLFEGADSFFMISKYNMERMGGLYSGLFYTEALEIALCQAIAIGLKQIIPDYPVVVLRLISILDAMDRDGIPSYHKPWNERHLCAALLSTKGSVVNYFDGTTTEHFKTSVLKQPSKEKDIVIGMANNILTPSLLATFALSLRRVNEDCDIILLAKLPATDLELELLLLDLNIKMMWMEVPEAMDSLPVSVQRWFIYKEVLKMLQKRDCWVFLTDTRDVFFQKDPFAPSSFRMDAVHVFLEDMVIENCKHNSGWIKECYGAEALEKIKKFRVSCSGTVMGYVAPVLKYLDEMCEQFLKVVSSGCLTSSYGIDQGIHNYLVWARHGDDGNKNNDHDTDDGGSDGVLMVKHANVDDDGIVGTIGHGGFKMDKVGRIMNKNGVVLRVVHQFDRYAKLAEYIATRNAFVEEMEKF